MSLVFAAMMLALNSQDDLRHVRTPWVEVQINGFDGAVAYGGGVKFLRYATLDEHFQLDASKPIVWVARRDVRQTPAAGGDRATTTSTVWADSRSCPALGPVLQAVDSLPPIKPYRFEDLNLAEIKPPNPHGSIIMLKRFGESQGRQVEIATTDMTGDVLGGWWDRVTSELKDCWSPVEPAYP